MRTIKTYRKVGAFYIACEADFSTSIRGKPSQPICKASFRLRYEPGASPLLTGVDYL